jgi:hypothetical protein
MPTSAVSDKLGHQFNGLRLSRGTAPQPKSHARCLRDALRHSIRSRE